MATPNRSRLILIASVENQSIDEVGAALTGGDVASVILHGDGVQETEFSDYCDGLVPVIQAHEAAALVADNTRIADSSHADGIFLEKQKHELEHIIASFSPHNIVGCGGFKGRHGALQVGEHKPDFAFFGKLGGDIRPDAHPKNLLLAAWWSEVVQVQGVVMGGNILESVVECAASGAEFVALRRAVFEHSAGPAEAVRQANQILDAHAHRFDEEQVVR